MIRIIQCDGHIGKTYRLSIFRSCKNNILHIPASKLLGALFSQNPADCIANITFSAAVRSYDAGDPVMKFKIYFLCKGFKSLHLYIFQIHWPPAVILYCVLPLGLQPVLLPFLYGRFRFPYFFSEKNW